MYKKINLLFLAVMAVSNFLFFHVGAVQAAPIVAGVLSIDYPGSPGPLFNATNIAPGYEETKTLVVTNNGKVPHSFSIAVSGNLGSLADVIIIEPKVLNSVVWSKTVSQIAKSPDTNIIIGSLPPSGAASVQIRAYLPTEVGNDYQGKTTLSFSFVMGNENTDLAEPTGDGGQSGGSIPAVAARSLAGLYNRVVDVAQNLVQPEVTINPKGEVKGVETTNDEGKTEGEQTNNKKVCFWWWLLSIILAILLTIYGYFRGRREILFDWVWPLFGATILYLVHWIIHDYYTPSKWCPYFVFMEFGLLIIYFALINKILAAKKD